MTAATPPQGELARTVLVQPPGPAPVDRVSTRAGHGQIAHPHDCAYRDSCPTFSLQRSIRVQAAPPYRACIHSHYRNTIIEGVTVHVGGDLTSITIAAGGGGGE